MTDLDARALHHLRQALAVYGPGAPFALLGDYAATALAMEGRDRDLAEDAVLRAYDAHFRVWGAAV